ncbi:hypothetical protein JCM14036_17230 [Desulfotomaculum defluvii]
MWQKRSYIQSLSDQLEKEDSLLIKQIYIFIISSSAVYLTWKVLNYQNYLV